MTEPKPRAALPIENCIRYWEGILFYDQFLLEPSVKLIVEATLAHLREHQKHKEEDAYLTLQQPE